jgi:hypothetical protein
MRPIKSFIDRLLFAWKASSGSVRSGIAVLGVMSTASWLWDECLPSRPRPNFILFLPHWPWWAWTIAILGIACGIAIDHAYTKEFPKPSGVLWANGSAYIGNLESRFCQNIAAAVALFIFVAIWGWSIKHPSSRFSQIGSSAIPIPVSAPTGGAKEVPPPSKTTEPPRPVKPAPPVRPRLGLEVGGIIFSNNPTSNDVRAQIIISAANSGRDGYARDWKLSVKFAQRSVAGIQLFGSQEPVRGSVNLPQLEGQEFIPGKPIQGLLFFIIPKLAPNEIRDLMSCPAGGSYPAQLHLIALDASGATIGQADVPMNELYKQTCTNINGRG